MRSAGNKDSGEFWCATFSAAFSFVSSAIFWASMISASGKKPASLGAKHNAATSTLSCRTQRERQTVLPVQVPTNCWYCSPD